MLVQGLPPDGATARAVNGHAWTLSDFHRADQVDLLARIDVALRNAYRAEKAPPVPWPEPVWRPGQESPEQKRKAKKRAAQAAREGYEDIVAQVAPGRI